MRKMAGMLLGAIMLLGVVQAGNGVQEVHAAAAVPDVVQGNADSHTIQLDFDRPLTGKGSTGSANPSVPQELPKQGVVLTGAKALHIQSVYITGRQLHIIADQPLSDLEAVDVHLDAGIVAAAEGDGNKVLDYRVVTMQGKLSLLDQLDPGRAGFGLKEVVRLLTVQRPANITGHPGIDQEDARFLLSLMETGVTSKLSAARERMLYAMEQAGQLLDTAGVMDTAEWEAVNEAREAAAALIDRQASERALTQAEVRLQNAMDQLRYVHQDARVLPEPLSFEAAGIIQEHRFGPEEQAALQHDEQASASFNILLPQPAGSFHDVQAGDRLIINMGPSNPELAYTLTGADMARLGQSGLAVSVDAKRYFLEEKLTAGAVQPTVCLESGHAGSGGCSSPAVSLSGEPQFFIEDSSWEEDARQLASPVMVMAAPESMIRDMLFNLEKRKDITPLAEELYGYDPAFYVQLPGNKGTEDDYRAGDVIVLELSSRHDRLEYELQDEDIEQLGSGRDAVTFIFDARRHFLQDDLLSEKFTPKAFVVSGNGQQTSEAAYAFEEMVTDVVRPVLTVSATGKMPLGSTITVQSSKKGAIYVSDIQMSLGEYISQADAEAGQQYQIYFHPDIFMAGAALKVYAMDEAGNSSLNPALITLE